MRYALVGPAPLQPETLLPGDVYGNWVQDHHGTFGSAQKAAAAQGGEIVVCESPLSFYYVGELRIWKKAEPSAIELAASFAALPTEDFALLAIALERKRREGLPGIGSTGLDDGPYLPGKAPRKPSAAKTAEELRAIRAKAWETRRKNKGAKP